MGRVTSFEDGLAFPKAESSPHFTAGPHCMELEDPDRPEP